VRREKWREAARWNQSFELLDVKRVKDGNDWILATHAARDTRD
jgi:hypothetical protein